MTINDNELLIEELKQAVREDWLAARMEMRAKYAILGKPPKYASCPEIFVITPFSKELKPVYEDHISKVAKTLKYKVGTAKSIYPLTSILDSVWAGINAAQIVIADCTGGNRNVMYEIGLAHAIGKDTILISQSVEDVPSDFRHFKIIVYEFPLGMAQFEEDLGEAISGSRSSNARNAF